ncbi:hypothetical protein A2W32_00335 [candidate division WWE3 bacterium RBG_16_37_10]|uniref:Camelysin metallo-endopeptidase n=1 Tax=candidate division WWE3 bacterium RBG_16_37_10 TaxID=1802610 RepID=A0A1F4V1B2_UNCKA|nr:MAG: hypothetical protein A2W32_00335 [candidate division WWE3 bacterium RBG_16_37_10]
MNKVVSGLLGLTVVVGLVVGAAVAQFNDAASLTNLALSVGSPDLLIKLTGGESFLQEVNIAGSFFDTLVPGEFDEVLFELRNNSTGNLDFSLTGKIPVVPTPSEDWTALKDEVECVVYLQGGDPESVDTAVSSGWKTLNTWLASQDLPGDPLNSSSEEQLVLRCKVPSDAPNSVAGQEITDLEFEVTGEQILGP